MKRLVQFIERRLFSRDHVRLPVIFTIVRGKPITSSHEGAIVDMSKTGCCIEVDKLSFDGFHLLKCLEEVGSYRFVMVFHGGETELSGNIRWINSDTEGKWHGFKIGIEFVTPITKEMLTLLSMK